MPQIDDTPGSINGPRNPSLWLATSDWPEFPPLRGDMAAQAVVVGSGITGLTAARLLTEEGLTVALIDSGRLCSGVTAFTTAKVTALQSTIYSELTDSWGKEVAATYAAANLAGLDRIRRSVEGDQIDCDLRSAPAYTYSESAASVEKIEAEVVAAQRAGLQVSFTSRSELPYEIAGAVRLDDQARFHPRRYCQGLLRGILARGGAVFEHTRAIDIDHRVGSVTTDRGVISAAVIVIASHIPFVNTGAYFARMTASRSYAVAFRSDHPPLEGMYISVDEPTRSLRAAATGLTLVGGEGHPVGQDEDTKDRYRALESWSAERFGADGVDYRWSAHDYRSADGLPFVGPIGASGRVFMATGFAKWGMANASTAAAIMVDLAMGRPNQFAPIFDSKRLGLKQGAPGILRAAADMAKSRVGERILHPPKLDVGDLGPGEGDVVSRDGRKAAVFREEDGSMHAVSPFCTHLGCQLELNTAERTWDCPCHGSRFDLDGHVIHGPAVDDLAPIEQAPAEA